MLGVCSNLTLGAERRLGSLVQTSAIKILMPTNVAYSAGVREQSGCEMVWLALDDGSFMLWGINK